MITELLNSMLMKRLSLVPFTATTNGYSVDSYTYCSDGSCRGDCVGGCDGTPAGGF